MALTEQYEAIRIAWSCGVPGWLCCLGQEEQKDVRMSSSGDPIPESGADRFERRFQLLASLGPNERRMLYVQFCKPCNVPSQSTQNGGPQQQGGSQSTGSSGPTQQGPTTSGSQPSTSGGMNTQTGPTGSPQDQGNYNANSIKCIKIVRDVVADNPGAATAIKAVTPALMASSIPGVSTIATYLNSIVDAFVDGSLETVNPKSRAAVDAVCKLRLMSQIGATMAVVSAVAIPLLGAVTASSIPSLVTALTTTVALKDCCTLGSWSGDPDKPDGSTPPIISLPDPFDTDGGSGFPTLPPFTTDGNNQPPKQLPGPQNTGPIPPNQQQQTTFTLVKKRTPGNGNVSSYDALAVKASTGEELNIPREIASKGAAAVCAYITAQVGLGAFAPLTGTLCNKLVTDNWEEITSFLESAVDTFLDFIGW